MKAPRLTEEVIEFVMSMTNDEEGAYAALIDAGRQIHSRYYRARDKARINVEPKIDDLKRCETAEEESRMAIRVKDLWI